MTLFELAGKLTLDDKEYTKGINNAESAISKVADGAKKVGAVITASLGAAATAAGALVKQAVDAYSDYEQLKGGVETLFKDSADEVMEHAHKAYETAGMSANQYMETVTSFASSLIQSTGRQQNVNVEQLQASLDKEYNATKRNLQDQYDATKKYYDDKIKLTKNKKQKKALQDQRDEELKALKRQNEDSLKELKNHNKQAIEEAKKLNETSVESEASLSRAAQLADQAIQDMADNANKMGTDISSIQNAYAGFAKQNYTMLDNLKLGYGGTKEEMERLLRKAEEISGFKYDISSYADIVEAIHVVQTELGITGTTAKEAAGTIQGSTAKMKSAWENLKVAIVDPEGNIPQAIANLTSSIGDAAKNWIPAIKRALTGLGKVIVEIAPYISAELPALITELLPDIVTAALTLFQAAIKGLAENIPVILPILLDALVQIIDTVAANIGPILNTLWEAIKKLWEIAVDKLKDAWDGIATWFNDNVWQPILDFFKPVWEFLQKLWTGIVENVSAAWNTIADWFNNSVWKPISDFFTAAWDVIVQLWSDVKKNIVNAWSSISNWFNESVWKPISNAFNKVWEFIVQLWTDIKKNISNAWVSIANWFNDTVWKPISDFFKPVWDFIVNLWTDIKKNVSNAWVSIANWFDDTVWKPILDFFRPVWDFITNLWTDVKKNVSNAWVSIANWFNNTVWKPIADFFKPVWEFIANLWKDVKKNVVNAWTSIANWFNNTVWKPIANFFKPVWELIQKLWNGVTGRVQLTWNNVVNLFNRYLKPITDLFNRVKSAVQKVIDKVREFFGLATDDKGVFQGGEASGYDWGEQANQNAEKLLSGVSWNAKGDWNVPYDNYLAQLHRGEMVLTASQARKYRDDEGSSIDINALARAVVGAIREGMNGVVVDSYLDGRSITGDVNHRMLNDLKSRRFANA